MMATLPTVLYYTASINMQHDWKKVTNVAQSETMFVVLQVNNMALDENVGDDGLRFVLTDETPSSDLQLVCQVPNGEVRENWITQIHSILDMQGDLLRGNFHQTCISVVVSRSCLCK